MLETIGIERQRAHGGELRLVDAEAVIDAGNAMLQIRKDRAEDHHRIRRQSAGLSAVNGTREGAHLDVDDAVAAQTIRQRWDAGGEVRRVAEDDEVAGEERAMFGQQRLQMRRSDLLFSFDEQL